MLISKKLAIMISIFTSVLLFEIFLIISINDDNTDLMIKRIPVMQKMNNIKFHVEQVQQWLTDISATRGLNGLDDGFDKAKENADAFKHEISELILLDPDNKTKFEALIPTFNGYYEIGKKMAQAYIKHGAIGGNKMMAHFDKIAEKIAVEIDELLKIAVIQTNKQLINQNKVLTRTIFGILISSILLGIIMLIIFISGRNILKILPLIIHEIKKMSNGNMQDFNLKTSRVDEIGIFINEINNMHQTLNFIVNETANTSYQLSETVNQLSTIAQQTQSHMKEQDSQVLQIVSAIDKINTSASETSDNAQNATLIVKETNQLTSQGEELANNTKTTISELSKEVDSASHVIQQLGKDSDDIGSILDVIKSIAEQTNLLALNAAIEAARAGEQGRGFAVVADEVRTLAGRTQQSTKEIQEVINRLQVSSIKAIEAMKKSKTIAEYGSEHINQTSEIIIKINTAMNNLSQINHITASVAKEQNKMINDVSLNIHNISSFASDTLSMSNKLLTINNSLGMQAKKLHTHVSSI